MKKLVICLLGLQMISLIQGIPSQKEELIIQEKPTTQEKNPEPDCKNDLETDVYDRRQNGSENYKINIKGVEIIVASADAAVAAVVMQQMENQQNVSSRPQTETETSLRNASRFRHVDGRVKSKIPSLLHLFHKLRKHPTVSST